MPHRHLPRHARAAAAAVAATAALLVAGFSGSASAEPTTSAAQALRTDAAPPALLKAMQRDLGPDRAQAERVWRTRRRRAPPPAVSARRWPRLRGRLGARRGLRHADRGDRGRPRRPGHRGTGRRGHRRTPLPGRPGRGQVGAAHRGADRGLGGADDLDVLDARALHVGSGRPLGVHARQRVHPSLQGPGLREVGGELGGGHEWGEGDTEVPGDTCEEARFLLEDPMQGLMG